MSVQDRLQLKREPLDKWSIREQLCLASAVARSGDQNWMCVSRALKSFGEPNRPADWFHQKNCAAQYGALLGNVETPKRTKKRSGVDLGIETPAENILRRLLAERQAELRKLLAEEKAEYHKLQEDMRFLQSGKVSEEQLDKWCKEIDEEEFKREQEAIAHAQWLKEREQRKQETERVWRPAKPVYQIPGQKRKSSDTVESILEAELEDSQQQINYHQMQQAQLQQQNLHISTPEPAKPALSPLLTSLLKSPSQVQNAVTSSSILHTAITSQRTLAHTSSNATISSLLNSSTAHVSVSPGLQNLVTTAIGQDMDNLMLDDHNQPLTADILDDPNLQNLKLDDLASSILVQDGPLPEIKKEEVDELISEIIENAQDIVADPEQHLQLDGNGDININLELDDLDEDDMVTEIIDSPPKVEEEKLTEYARASEVPQPVAPPAPTIDPFEFQEDPVIFEHPLKSANLNGKQDSAKQYIPQYQQLSLQQDEKRVICEETAPVKLEECAQEPITVAKEVPEEKSELQKSVVPGSVEIVEVMVMDEGESDKELNKSQIQNIVHSADEHASEKTDIKIECVDNEHIKTETEDTKTTEETESCSKSALTYEEHTEESKVSPEIKTEPAEATLEEQEAHEASMLTDQYTDELYDNLRMEVKIDKSGRAKRDYSRTKKKEDKGFDVLLAIEKAQLEESDFMEDTLSDNAVDGEKKDVKVKLKSETDRSNSPWTEEEDINNPRSSRRRYSTPATPIDSLPNSPASSVAYFDDDRDYRNWKKSVMLLYARLSSNKYASLFLKPITEADAPGYSHIVYRPMDLQTIKKNIESGAIRNTLEFKRDVMLMFTNAIMYNRTNDTIYEMAREMQQESIEQINIFMQAQGQAGIPVRRETRTSESNSSKRKRTAVEDIGKIKKRKED